MTGKDNGKVNRASFSLEPEYQELLRKIAQTMRSNQTVELRRMIDERAAAIGLTPIAPIIPKAQPVSNLSAG